MTELFLPRSILFPEGAKMCCNWSRTHPNTVPIPTHLSSTSLRVLSQTYLNLGPAVVREVLADPLIPLTGSTSVRRVYYKGQKIRICQQLDKSCCKHRGEV